MTQLNTDRLTLTEIGTQDSEFIYQLLNSPGWLQFIGDRSIKNIEDAERYIQNSFIASYEKHGFGLYKIALKDSSVPIGVCGLLKRKSLPDMDLGYALLPEYGKQGYAFEAAQIVIKYAQTSLHCKKLLAFTTENNEKSQRLLKKLGFVFEGIKKIKEFEENSAVFSIKF